MNKKVEILAPAGSFDCLVAALKSGADAIYVGGEKFGARANAHNFTEEELKQAIDLVHLHGKQLYLTINTLLKEEELKNELYAYLSPLYVHGIDAVIVQDLGVLQFVKEYFPGLPIHASTQMTVTNLLGATFLERQGVERVVTSRELSVSEVAEIAQNTSLEIESFVHGALCYSFSGQCLFSSMIGDRSGNRGQCAQPCRLPYSVEHEQEYMMSLKDICTLQDIPDLVEAGVYSFKIEGRMKKPEYVASVVSMYRKYVDMYVAYGRRGYNVQKEDVDELRDIFNRGDFHSGYWKQHNGKDMITHGKPSHTGTPVVKVVSQNGRMVSSKALNVLHRGDILEISTNGDNYTLGNDYQIGDMLELSLRKGVRFNKGDVLYRTRNQWLIDNIHSELDGNKLQESIEGTLVLIEGANAALHLEFNGLYLSVEGSVVERAQNAPIEKDKICKQMNKTGNTPFQFHHLEIVMDDHIFVPNQQLNQLRREALEQLEVVIVEQYRRVLPAEVLDVQVESAVQQGQSCNVYIETLEQLEVVLKEPIFEKVYMDCNMLPKIWKNQELGELVVRVHDSDKKVYLVMPHIFRKNTIQCYQEHYEYIVGTGLDGIMVRNLESYEFLYMNKYKGEIILDHHVYNCNTWVNRFWGTNGVCHRTHSLELTCNEMKYLNSEDMELVIYGYTPNMVSAQCIKKTMGKCTHSSDIIKMRDRLNKEFPVKSCCDYCYNVVYHHCPTSIMDEKEAIDNMKIPMVRVNFTVESRDETEVVIDALKNQYYRNSSPSSEWNKLEITKGHFRRGVR